LYGRLPRHFCPLPEPHPVSSRMPRPPPTPDPPPLASADVYVDDFIALAQGSPARANRIRRILLHTIDETSRPNDSSDPDGRREIISLEKLLKGDACWSTLKVVLGWLIDSVHKTIELPPHRQLRLLEILTEVRGRSRVSVKVWHRLLGELLRAQHGPRHPWRQRHVLPLAIGPSTQ
jgi:hypothetical protein